MASPLRKPEKEDAVSEGAPYSITGLRGARQARFERIAELGQEELAKVEPLVSIRVIRRTV